MINRRSVIGGGLSAIAAPAILSSAAFGQEWPSRVVRLVVPFPAGGPTDTVGRMFAQRFQEMWKQPVVIENKPGAGGNLGADYAAKSEPDGYTIFITGTTIATSKFLYPSLTYDVVNDFQPVSQLLSQANIMAVPNTSPAKTVKEFVDYCKANAGKVTYATPGVGTSQHLAGELFNRMAGVQMTQLPYRGMSTALNDLMAGRSDVTFDVTPSIMQHVKEGMLRGLAVTAPKRLAVAPDIPTVDEAGVKGFDLTSWYAIFYQKRVPKGIVEKVHAATVEAINHESVRKVLLDLGTDPIGSTPDELGRVLQADLAKWGPVIRDANIRIN
jgi:tripartite-type tricarboxylate transporter receptor subunit TctC